MKRFGNRFGCATCVVAHPTKLEGKMIPGLYNISDSAHWANKPDLGVVVHACRPDEAPNERTIFIPKVRLKRIAGNTGSVDVGFNEKTGLFTKLDF
jgi:twinkle protein